jgi:class 3 adenylate cyclase
MTMEEGKEVRKLPKRRDPPLPQQFAFGRDIVGGSSLPPRENQNHEIFISGIGSNDVDFNFSKKAPLVSVISGVNQNADFKTHKPPLPQQDASGRDISGGSSLSSSIRHRRGSQETNFSALSSDEDFHFSKIPRPRLGDRTKSTASRLSRQGFRPQFSGSNFAVKFIERGSDDWRLLVKPFVSDLAFRSIVSRRCQSEVSFEPYTCHAAVLFVDLSSYSKITAAIADRGAHALSNIVNAYLTKILQIVRRYGGDVVKFAGDAVLIVWEGEESDLDINVLCAAKCAVELQDKASSYPVEGTSLEFRIHCGLCSGPLESEIFEAPTHVNMQRLYHSVGGESLYEISELVDLAKAGEICISAACVDLMGQRGSFKDIEEDTLLFGAKLLTTLALEKSLSEEMNIHIDNTLSDRMLRRSKEVEEDFIHPTVLRLLSHGGLSPTQIAQMRNLCVLFIAMTSQGSSVNWLMEVQGVLDTTRCPIVQIIDDDKGVHIVAAVNLYEMVPEATIFGLEACRKLVDKQCGCAIGVAMGPTFCGVTGSNSIACRWDITGPPAVRAARLMQYALANELEVAVDESVYSVPSAASRLEVIDSFVQLKGSMEPVAVYSISESSVQCAYRLLETVHGSVHNDLVREIQTFIEDRRRSAVVVTGIPYSGKSFFFCDHPPGCSAFLLFRSISQFPFF